MRPSSFLLIFLLSLRGCGTVAFAQDDLPNDKDKKQLVVIAPNGSAVASWFEESTKLRLVKKATAFTLLAPTSKLFESRYADMLGTQYPIVAYMRPDGGLKS